MIFHLAIPAKDLNESIKFYQDVLGCRLGRTTIDAAILSFFYHQIVLHQSDDVVSVPTMYPRHFGIIFASKLLLDIQWKLHKGKPYVFAPMFTRNRTGRAEHQSFFLKDPSNNLIEFKRYKNPEAIFT